MSAVKFLGTLKNMSAVKYLGMVQPRELAKVS